MRSYLPILLVIIFQSCNKFVDIEPAPELIETQELFTNDATAVSAVNGVYALIRESSPSLANGSLSIYGGLAADELVTTTPDLEYEVFQINSILPNSTVVNYQFWNPAYRIIYRTNIIIENLQKSKTLSIATKNQLTGEMKVVRAFYYFYLVNIFGEVPLITSSDYRENQNMPRKPVNSIYEQIVGDLNSATELLVPAYPSSGKLRPNQFTAIALLSRVHLYMQNWDEAESAATVVINSAAYNLVSPLSSVFKKNSAETIWEIAAPNELRNTVEGSVFVAPTTTSIPVLCLTQTLLNTFEPGDKRKIDWAFPNNVQGVDYYYPFKYKLYTSSPIEEYTIVFRLVEQFLIRAEARARLNNIAGAQADLDTIRKRADLANTTAADVTALLDAIQRERQTELFAEWGHRWFDLKRTGNSDSILSAIKGGDWQYTDTLYPIPFDQLQLNPSLVQNPGY